MIKCKEVTITESDTFPVSIWVPSDSKFVDPTWYSFTAINKGTGVLCCDMNLKTNGELSPLVRIGLDENITVDSDQRDFPLNLSSDIGDGSTAVITLSKDSTHHTATSFVVKICVWGKET